MNTRNLSFQKLNDTMELSYQKRFKWIFLLITEIFQIGIFFNMSSTNMLQVQFEKLMGIDEIDYSHMVQAISIPGIIFPLIFGMFVDSCGESLGFILGFTSAIFGQFILFAGVLRANFGIFIVGLFVKSSGLSLQLLCKNKMIKRWYVDDEIGIVISITFFTVVFTNTISNFAYPTMYEYANSLKFPFFVGSLISAVSGLFGFVMVVFHNRLLNEMKLPKAQASTNLVGNLKNAINEFPSTLKLVIAVATLSQLSYYSTQMYESKFLQISFDFTIKEVGILLASAKLISGSLTPVVGFVLNKLLGNKLAFLIGITMSLGGIIGNIAFPPCSKCSSLIIPQILMSLGSSVSGLVILNILLTNFKVENVATSMALVSTITNIGVSLYPLPMGYLAQATVSVHGYFWVFLVNAGFETLSLLIVLGMIITKYPIGPEPAQCSVSIQKDSEFQSFIELKMELVSLTFRSQLKSNPVPEKRKSYP